MMHAPARKDGCPAPPGPPARGTPARASQAASERWVAALAGTGPAREQALADLHDLLLRGAHHEIRRRRAGLTGVPDRELEELAGQAANDAMVAILAKLPTFRGDSRFTTWAYKFVLLEAGVKLRRRAWQGREVTLEPAAWPAFPAPGLTAQEGLEQAELIGAIRTAVASSLTPHQREVFVALALNGVPIDVLAERLTTTRGALYKTLHDARRKLRGELAKAGLDLRRTT